MRQHCSLAYRLNNSAVLSDEGLSRISSAIYKLPPMQTFNEFNFSYDFTTTKQMQTVLRYESFYSHSSYSISKVNPYKCNIQNAYHVNCESLLQILNVS